MSDTHRELYFARWDARNRLVTGGAAMFPGATGASLAKPIGERLSALWPQLGAVEFDYIWSGYVGMTPDSLRHPEVPGFPRFHRLGPNGFAWVGCNGRAVALSITLGRELARAVCGVPDSGVAYAVGYANESKKPFTRPFIKYTPTWPRSFMPDNPEVRHRIAKMKMIIVERVFIY